jgi:hypothetical protein
MDVGLRFQRGRTIQGTADPHAAIWLQDWEGRGGVRIGFADAEGRFVVHGLPTTPIRVRIWNQEGTPFERSLAAATGGDVEDLGVLTSR